MVEEDVRLNESTYYNGRLLLCYALELHPALSLVMPIAPAGTSLGSKMPGAGKDAVKP